MSSPDLLKHFAELHRLFPLGSASAGGKDLQESFATFLQANADASQEDIVADIITAAARALVSTSLAFHGGKPCKACIYSLSSEMGRAIGREFQSHIQARAQEN